MFNHHYDKIGQTYWKYEDSTDSFDVRAQRAIPINDAVFFAYSKLSKICENYGQKPNYRFLFYYGFLIDNNNKNAVYIRLQLSKSDSLAPIKENMIGTACGRDIRTFKYFENYAADMKTNDKLLGYLRFFEYEGNLNDIGQYFNPPIENVKTVKVMKRKLRLPPVSVDNEKKMLARLKLIAEASLKKYPQTYEEDVKILKEQEKTLSFNQRNSLIFRMGEKKVFFTTV